MHIQHQDNGKKGRYYVLEGEEELVEMTYVWSGEERIIIDHTFVDERLKGRGVGYMLVESAVEMARERGIKVIPLCPFAKSVFEKKEEYADVLA